MKFILILVALFTTFTLITSFSLPPKEIESRINSLVEKYLSNPENAGLCIGVVKGDKEMCFCYGQKNKFTQAAVDSNSIFEIGSITKIFTSLILAQEVERGKMNLKDKLSDYFPGGLISKDCSEINLLQLASHSSGLPRLADNFWSSVGDKKNPYCDYSEKYLLNYLTLAKPYYKIGTRYNYSNVGCGLLGFVLCRNMQSSYQELVNENVCSPLGMKNTSVNINNLQLLNLASGHSKGSVVKNWDFQDATAGQGALKSNVLDMIKFIRNNLYPDQSPFNGAIRQTQQIHFIDSMNGIQTGLGWHLGYFSNEKYLEHTGGTGGYRSFLGIIPESKIGIVVLSNSDNDVSVLGKQILKEFHKNTF
ncbi:MAG: beta-lactamase family protein [Bacteroidetes bacterium]|nr:beta-lactamase family protein [Bacteroidota bacterium]HET6244205.1 serine hydrolase [Bacteroidia bacterium]